MLLTAIPPGDGSNMDPSDKKDEKGLFQCLLENYNTFLIETNQHERPRHLSSDTQKHTIHDTPFNASLNSQG